MVEPKKIVITTFGSYGDIHPSMALAIELQARGHLAVIATSGLYQEKIESAGLQFFPVRPNLPPPQEQDQELMDKIMEPRTGPKFLIDEIILGSLRDSYDDLVAAVAGADLLVTHPTTFAGPLVARKFSIPWISTVLAPVSFFSAYDPPEPPYWPWISKLQMLGPGFMKALLNFVKRGFTLAPVENLRRELGIAEYGHPMFEGQHSPDLVLALFSSIFAAPQPDWPKQAVATGFAFYDGHRELEMPAALTQFLAAGPAPIVFTLGSSAVWVARDFFRESVAAAQSLGQRAILLVGDERNCPAESLPPGIIAADYAPYQSLLPQASVMVHHGGVGTTSQGLRAGVPTLIVPFAFDQPDNAAHAARLGTSRTLYRKKYQSDRVAKELDLLLRNPQYASKAKLVGEHLRQEQGTNKACDLIEDSLTNSQTSKSKKPEPVYAASH